MNFLAWIEQLGFSTWVRESGSLLGYPTILFLHTIGLATVAGISSGICLRLIGFAPRVPVAALKRFFPIMWVGFGFTVFSGIALLMADATSRLTQPVFFIKLIFVGLAVTNLQMLKTRVFDSPLIREGGVPPNAVTLSMTLLVFWLAATTSGRLIAYVY
jgi:hypothetical protein